MATQTRIQIDEDRSSKIKHAKGMLNSISKAAYGDLRAHLKPRDAMRDTMFAVLILIGSEQSDWTTVRDYLRLKGKDALRERCYGLEPETLTDDRRKKARKLASKYRDDEVKDCPPGVFEFHQWVLAMTEDCPKS